MSDPRTDIAIDSNPQRGFQNAISALNRDRARSDATIKAESAEMAPAIKEAEGLLATPRPQMGKTEKVSEEPSADTGKPGQEWIAATALLAGIAGAFSRQHLTSALTAFAAGVQGLRQGQIQAYDQAFKKWQAAAEKARLNNQQVLDEYKTALEDRRASMDEIKQRIGLIATKYKDQIMADAARRDDDTFLAQVYSQQVAAQDRYAQWLDRLREQHDIAMQKIDVDLAKNGLTRDQSTGQIVVDQGGDSPIEKQAQAIAKYQQAPLSSVGQRSPLNRIIMSRVMEINPQYQASLYGQRARANIGFGTGKQGDQVRALNVAIDHLDTADSLIDALGSGNVQEINRARAVWKEEFGSDAPTNLEQAGQIIGQEMVKAVISGGGGVTERLAAGGAFENKKSTTQLHGGVQTVRKLMAGQMRGLKKQYEATTGLDDFEDRFLEQRTRQVLDALPPSGAGRETTNIPRPKTQAEYDALPSGAIFEDDEGQKRKP